MLTETTRHEITVMKSGRRERTTIEVIRRDDGAMCFRTTIGDLGIMANTVNSLIMAILERGIGVRPSELSDVMRGAYPAKA